MNIFILSTDPELAAQYQCDKHVVKMCVESAQMLSAAHRLLDNITTADYRDNVLYRATHVNHPCTRWTMETSGNYNWHLYHWLALCKEYQYRYGKKHKSYMKLAGMLSYQPRNIKLDVKTPFVLAMKSNPECMNVNDPVASYRSFYHTKQNNFAMKWEKNRDEPVWFKRNC